MTHRERTRIIHKRLYDYAAAKREIKEYTDRAIGKTSKLNETGVHGSFISDPTGHGGASLAQLPAKMEARRQWCEAIDETMAECRIEDGGCENGLAKLMTVYFCLDVPRRKKGHNADAIERICTDCGISRSTFFKRLAKITDKVLYYATKRKLI